MTAGQSVARRATSPSISLAPAALVGLLASMLLVGSVIGVAVKSQTDRTSVAATVGAAQSAPSAADRIKFRLEELNGVQTVTPRDRIIYRNSEQGVVAPAPSFDLRKFLQEEHGIDVPAK